jgi:hypothetical protein
MEVGQYNTNLSVINGSLSFSKNPEYSKLTKINLNAIDLMYFIALAVLLICCINNVWDLVDLFFMNKEEISQGLNKLPA